MKFTRRYTEPGRSPYTGADFVTVPLPLEKDSLTSGSAAGKTAPSVAFPAHWSAGARGRCLENCLVLTGIARNLAQVTETDVPTWLWRSEPNEDNTEYCSEASLTQAIDRLCGGWAYQGWKGGYFDSEDDARIYYDDCRWLLFYQKLSPSISHWQYGGRYWAYGHDVSVPDTYLTDYRTGLVRRAEKPELPPLGTVINAANKALAGEGGVWDLWRREAEILSHGGTSGVNIGDFLSTDQLQATSGIAEVLDMGDGVARISCPSRTTNTPGRRRTIDAAHPACGTVVNRSLEKLAEKEAGAVGAALSARHVQAIIDACARPEPNAHQGRSDSPNAALRLALQSARQALLPDELIERTLYLAQKGLVDTASDLLGSSIADVTHGADEAADAAITVVRLDAIGPSDSSRHDQLLESTAIACWTGIESGLQFGPATDAWNTCPASGSIRSASGDGSYLFLDDTAADAWFINASAFQETDRQFEVEGYRYAVEMLAVTADISLMSATAVTPRLARRVWDFRPLSLSVTGLATCLIRAGLAYDSAGGRAFSAGVSALLSGTAYRTSARMAEELGAFPEFEKNREDMLHVLDRHGDMAAACAHEMSPQGFVEAIEDSWSEAHRLGSHSGLRHAQVSALCDDSGIAALLDATTSGPAPLHSLIINDRSSVGFSMKRINPAIPSGLRTLGYCDTQIDAIVRHVVGHETLANAPGVNHETLRKRGFTEAAIDAVERTLSSTTDITLAFDPFVLGEDYCRHMLGFGDSELQDETFDMLAALGFSDAGIEAANIFCYGAGTMEGAPYLSPAHIATFHCMEPQGARGAGFVPAASVIEMMAAIQPHVSGAIGHTLQVAADASPEDCREYLDLGHRLGLKSISLKRVNTHLNAARPLTAETTRDSSALLGFAVVDGGQPANRQAVSAVNAESENRESAISRNTSNRTDVRDGVKTTADVSKASRRASSHAARSTTSVSSSADVVSSNGMFDVASP